METTPKFLSASDVAELLKVSERTLLRWRADGDGPRWFRQGPRRVVYDQQDVIAWRTARPGGCA